MIRLVCYLQEHSHHSKVRIFQMEILYSIHKEQNAPAQHWAMQPPPGFAAPATTGQLSNQQASTAAQPHTKLISAGSEIENL